ncbi:MAG: P-II family nitrogen regulator [Elusimicrobiota bacterium]|jgi:nitrogen regulatory protein PII|nr:P-II family nitrogen regulator [Elusimicrobiota bacterium]
MKEIKAIIRTTKLEKVVEALQSIKDLPGCIVSHVHGYGASTGHEAAEFTKLEIVVDDAAVSKVLTSIRENAYTGNTGDGKIFVISCADAVRIKDGKRGKAAL